MDSIEGAHSTPNQDSRKTCVLVDDHAFIHALRKTKDCKTFQDYVFFKVVTKHIDESVKCVDVVLDTYMQRKLN